MFRVGLGCIPLYNGAEYLSFVMSAWFVIMANPNILDEIHSRLEIVEEDDSLRRTWLQVQKKTNGVTLVN